MNTGMATDTTLAAGPGGAAASTDDDGAALARLAPDVLAGLTAEQKDAIAQAYGVGWKRHPVNIRLSMPWVGGRFFLTLVGGSERRAPRRRTAERQHHPLKTAGNLFFAVGLGTVFYMGAVVVLALQSSIIEF